MKKIELDIECQSCNGTGVYRGMGERDGASVVCFTCDGTGCFKYKFEYTLFKERKIDLNGGYINYIPDCKCPGKWDVGIVLKKEKRKKGKKDE